MQSLQRTTGLSLIVGSIMMTITMIFHPSGGSFQTIIVHAPLTIATHGLAILAAPFAIFGFWGLSQRMQAHSHYAVLALIFATLGFLGAMVAAAINGITLPGYVLSLGEELESHRDQLRLIVRYGSFLNRSMDYIFMGGVLGAMILISGINLRSREFPVWTSYLGFVVTAGILTVPFLVSVTSLFGFRSVVFGVVVWITSVGLFMRQTKEAS